MDILNDIIIGRVEPNIYAFTTETVPNYLKVGDTYRPVEKRLEEWRKYFPNLVRMYSDLAKVDDKTYFRDFAVHNYLENDMGKSRLQKDEFDVYYSNEFFKDVTVQDVKDAISDIKLSFNNNDKKYQFYSFNESRLPISYTYNRTEAYEPRPNQQETINKFREAVNAGRNNLLMYAVMRFGKTFTSMCCAVEIDAKLVIVVSAKADVKEEWKKTVQSHKNFEHYTFFDSNSLLHSKDALVKELQKNNVVVFLTLQDLCGDEIKTKHKEIFKNDFDLLIVDESHYGARATEYGKVLNITSRQFEKELKDADVSDYFDNNETLKTLRAKVRLHLSGTPYRILMGSEFAKDDIIAFYQFTDIAKDKKAWDDHFLMDDVYNEDEICGCHKKGEILKEWDNPYYGFPQMVRFAFNPNKSSMEKMDELKKKGITYAFSELLKPQSILKDTSSEHKHKKFIHEQEILDLLEVIDGSKSDENVLGFLDLEKIKNGNMCRHIVCVLPYRASCDALEKLVYDNKAKFKNFGEYQIINIAGVDNERQYADSQAVKRKIKEFESHNKKTLTLTVNRMLTGSTVEEWDTMIYLKDTASPQEYDQAIFRLQNQYIRQYKNSDGDIIKYNMKPQTLLVDFNPNRMFRLQEQKSQIYNVNTDRNGNSKLENRIEEELSISPIILLNKNKLQKVEPANILDAVREYSSDKSVMDEATDIPTDFSLLEDDTIKNVIGSLSPIDFKNGIEVKPTKGDGEDIDIPPANTKDEQAEPCRNGLSNSTQEDKAQEDLLSKKLATYYAQILFFAFLTDSEVISLEDIINVIDSDENDSAIASNVGLRLDILKIMQEKCNPFILSSLDYKIQNLNSLIKDSSLEPYERVEAAMKKFGRLSSSEIVTPMHIAEDMVDILPENDITRQTKILDVASKQGEFTRALLLKFGKKIRNNVYAIPTSTLTYEFTRKVYSLLGIPKDNVFVDFNSYDLINETKNKEIIKKLSDMKFDVIIGNPPYQVSDGGAQASAKPIYNHFVDVARQINVKYISMIIPSRWYAGGKGLDDFRNAMLENKQIEELHDFPHPEEVFPNTNNRGGVCFFLMNKTYDNIKLGTKVVTHQEGKCFSAIRPSLKIGKLNIFIRYDQALSILTKLNLNNEKDFMMSHISSRKPFGIEGNFILDNKFHSEYSKKLITCYGKAKKVGYISRDDVLSHSEWINRWKVYIPYANNIGTELNDDNQNAFVGNPNSVCTETFLVVGADLNLNEESSINLTNYLKTKFARFLHSLAKVSQHGTNKTYQFVPSQDFTSKSEIDWGRTLTEINKQLYVKYKLTENEISFIESMIKPME